MNPALVPDTEPKSTEATAGELRVRGYAATADKLKTLVRSGVLDSSTSEGKQAAWTRERIEAAAGIFEARQDFTTQAAFYAEYGLTMTDFVDALEAAFAAAIDEYGNAALVVLSPSANEDFFCMTIEPAFRNEPAAISFALAPKVRKEIEKKGRK